MLAKSPFHASNLTESSARESGIYARFMLAIFKKLCSVYGRNASFMLDYAPNKASTSYASNLTEFMLDLSSLFQKYCARFMLA